MQTLDAQDYQPHRFKPSPCCGQEQGARTVQIAVLGCADVDKKTHRERQPKLNKWRLIVHESFANPDSLMA
jgi:hypothetical protein